METRKIGSLSVSVVGLGCNNFGRRLEKDDSIAVVRAAIDSGINFFDTSDTYGRGLSEEYLGVALGAHRDRVVIATKFGKPMSDGKQGSSPAYIRAAVEDSLRRLGTDYIDLYQQHEPDDSVALEETLGTLSELVSEGKVREVGTSNVMTSQLEEMLAVESESNFVSVQNEFSLLQRNAELTGLLDVCAAHDVAFLPYFPLAAGALTGKYLDGDSSGGRLESNTALAEVLLSNENVQIVKGLGAFCEERGHSLVELAFSWLLTRPAIASVIAGATSEAQIRANVSAAAWSLTTDDLAEIDKIAPVRDIPLSLS